VLLFLTKVLEAPSSGLLEVSAPWYSCSSPHDEERSSPVEVDLAPPSFALMSPLADVAWPFFFFGFIF
jgi:hypothetical protein